MVCILASLLAVPENFHSSTAELFFWGLFFFGFFLIKQTKKTIILLKTNLLFTDSFVLNEALLDLLDVLKRSGKKSNDHLVVSNQSGINSLCDITKAGFPE